MEENEEIIVRENGFMGLKDSPMEKEFNKTNMETHEIPEPEVQSLEETQEILGDLRENSELDVNYLRKVLSDSKNESLRKIFVGIVQTNPGRMGEIEPYLFTSKRTNYSRLHQLRSLGLIDIVPVLDILEKKKDLTPNEKKIKEKFNLWTSQMSERQRNRFAGTTNYYSLTELGKEPRLLSWVVKHEKKNYVSK